MNDTSQGKPSLDLTRIKALMDKGEEPQFWRSLEEVADTEEFKKFLEDEFPDRTPDWNEPSHRRTFLKVMGASLALAGLTACAKQPTEYIVPYVHEPEEFVPGRPMFFATAMEMGGCGTGLLVESHLGRPTKVEGNPDHPGSLGAADYFHQASVLTMYDPDRSQVVIYNGEIASWVNFEAAVLSIRAAQAASGGNGLRILTETVLSPTLAAQLDAVHTAMPGMQWHHYEPAAKVGSAGGRDGRVRAAHEHDLRLRQGGRDRVAGREFSIVRRGESALRARFCEPAAHSDQRHEEPPSRRRTARKDISRVRRRRIAIRVRRIPKRTPARRRTCRKCRRKAFRSRR